jgi:FkbM family methyltransferase
VTKIRTVSYDKSPFNVNLENDFYGDEYWDRFESGQYEPDTINFLEKRLNNETTFIDLGAANGGMTLVAAKLNSKVISFEPNPIMYNVTKENVKLNSDLSARVTLRNEAVSVKEGILNFESGENSKILSEIVFDGNESGEVKIKVASLSDIINEILDKCPQDKIVIKMDIEGAEWTILNDPETLRNLKDSKATILLAVHPGFYRPHKKRVRGFDKLSLILFHIRNYRESIKTFYNLSKYSQIFRTNLNRISTQRQFALLIFSGYHEFVVQF